MRVIHPDTSYFTYQLDGLDRLLRVHENGTDPITVMSYDPAGRRATSAWNMATYAYDPAGRLQTLGHNPLGTDRDHVLGFGYNPASQIVSRSASNDAFAWTGASNVTRPYAVNGLNQYTAAGSAAFGYDPNGNLASTVNAPWSTAYVYDVENRLVSASGTHNAELAYDPLGRLWQVSSGGAVRRLVYDGDALIAEYDAAGTMPHRYVHGNDAGADDPLIWWHNAVEGWRRFLLTDHQGSVIGTTDMYGNSIAANSYDPWGIPGANNLGSFGYTGQTWVPELGLWYYKARFYSPTLGRFLQVDPIGYKDQMNLYAYVANDPINHTDPDGKELRVRGTDEFRNKVKAQLRLLYSKPNGRVVVQRLMDSKNVHRIVESRRGNTIVPQGPSRNGIGDGSQISFNPNRTTTDLPDDKGSFTTPAFIQLGHELGHAYAIDRGIQSEQMLPETPGTTPLGERPAMRIEGWIRAEHRINPRSHYYPDPDK